MKESLSTKFLWMALFYFIVICRDISLLMDF